MKKNKKRTILITGICGCIGSHLLDELLARGENVIGIDNLSYGKLANVRRHLKNPNFKFHRMDVRDFPALRGKIKKVDIILHTASVKKVGESQSAIPTLNVNAIGTENLLKLSRVKKSKIVIFSTSDVYGLSDRIPFREDDICVVGASTAKRWSYAISKLYSEQIALSYHKDFGVPVVVLRYFGVFSERSSTGWSGGPIPSFTEAILKGKPVTIHGDGSQTRSMGHVDDTVRGTLLTMDNPRAVGEIINIGNDEEMSVLETARLIHELSGAKKPLKLQFIPMKKLFGTYQEIPRRVPDLTKARRILGYRPQVSYRQGLGRVIEYHKVHS